LPHLAFALQSNITTGCILLPLFRTLKVSASATKRYAPSTAQATLFCLISSEAYLLSKKKEDLEKSLINPPLPF
jgi:hypothetical protein